MRKNNYRVYNQAESVPTTKVLQHPTKPGVFYPVHRRPLRRSDMDYAYPQLVCFVTFNVQNGCEVTFSGETGDVAWAALREALAQTGATVHAACLMPDHVHLLISPSGKGETISDIVARAKSWVCFVLKRNDAAALRWQNSFYDHCLRESELTEDIFHTIIHYIRRNPQNAGLPEDYPYVI